MSPKYPSLIILKEVIAQVYADIIDDGRPAIKNAIDRLSPRPLFIFSEVYNDFIRYITSESDLLDRWVNVQIQVITALGNDVDALTDLIKLVKNSFSDTLGEGPFVLDNKSYGDQSFAIALAFRVYTDGFVDRSKP